MQQCRVIRGACRVTRHTPAKMCLGLHGTVPPPRGSQILMVLLRVPAIPGWKRLDVRGQ
jgi:hypothetical protein